MNKPSLRQGAEVAADGVRFCCWAPTRSQLEVRVMSPSGETIRTVALARADDGFFRGHDPAGRAGDLYKIAIDGGDAFPAPGSRFQPIDVHGPSEVIDPTAFAWGDGEWKRPAFRDLVIYELHIGTFTEEGTYRAAIEKLPSLKELGVTAIEIMPVADFPGERNWGYDGVHLFAPARCYGRPDDLRALVNAAHEQGLAVILDVVYNHFGPDGNYHTAFSPYYLESEDKTPWGDAINFGREHSGPVREYFKDNLLRWIEEYHIDGFRLDATHAIVDRTEPHILSELAEIAHAHGRYIIAEDERNDARLISPQSEGGIGMNAVWADDFHHIVEVATISASRYKEDYGGALDEMVAALECGWVQKDFGGTLERRYRGTSCGHLPPERFVFCISNHDQVGNRALGERLNHMVSAPTYRAASALLLLTPYTPLLYMGQEWAATTPFLYFTDHNAELGRLVEEGRREECRFAAHAPGLQMEDVPSPQARETFLRSKLQWEERSQGECGRVLALYQRFLELRRSHAAFRPDARGTFRVVELPWGAIALRYQAKGEEILMVFDLAGGHGGSTEEHDIFSLGPGRTWQFLASSNEPRFSGNASPAPASLPARLEFNQPELIVWNSVS